MPGQREERVKAVKFKGKRSMRQGPQAQQAQQYAGSGASAQPGFNVLQEGSEAKTENLVDQIEFEQRLKALQAESVALRQQKQQAAAGGGILDAGRQQDEDIYANVQPLAKTLLSRDDSGAAKEYEGAQFGPSQVGADWVGRCRVGVWELGIGETESNLSLDRCSAFADCPQAGCLRRRAWQSLRSC